MLILQVLLVLFLMVSASVFEPNASHLRLAYIRRRRMKMYKINTFCRVKDGCTV